MTQYLGICMVVIVITLCIGILSAIVSENIFKQYELHKRRVADLRWAAFGRFIIKYRDELKKEIDSFVKQYDLKKTKEIMDAVDKKTEQLKEQGVDIEKM